MSRIFSLGMSDHSRLVSLNSGESGVEGVEGCNEGDEVYEQRDDKILHFRT